MACPVCGQHLTQPVGPRLTFLGQFQYPSLRYRFQDHPQTWLLTCQLVSGCPFQHRQCKTMSNPCSYILQLPPVAYYQFRCIEDPGMEFNDLLGSKYISTIDSIKYTYQEEIDEPTSRINSLQMVSSKT